MKVRQFGMGWGALLTATAFLFFLTQGLAGARRWRRATCFVAGSIGLVVALVALFILYPTLIVLDQRARTTMTARWRPALFLAKFVDAKIWSLGCLAGGGRCGVAWNTLLLAVLTGGGTTLLGLAFALVVTRTGFRAKRAAAGADRAADHHAALRRRPRASSCCSAAPAR